MLVHLQQILFHVIPDTFSFNGRYFSMWYYRYASMWQLTCPRDNRYLSPWYQILVHVTQRQQILIHVTADTCPCDILIHVTTDTKFQRSMKSTNISIAKSFSKQRLEKIISETNKHKLNLLQQSVQKDLS